MLTKLLSKLVEAAPTVLAKITAQGEEGLTPREYLGFVKDIAKATELIAKANAHSVSTNRTANGVPTTAPVVHQHLHAQIATASPPSVLAPADGDGIPSTVNRTVEANGRMKQLLESYRRLTSPLVFDGMEDGIVDGDREDEDDSN